MSALRQWVRCLRLQVCTSSNDKLWLSSPAGTRHINEKFFLRQCSIVLCAVQCLGPEPRQLCLGAGFHYCKTLLSRVQMMLKLETDPSEILNELIYSCRKVLSPYAVPGCISWKFFCNDL